VASFTNCILTGLFPVSTCTVGKILGHFWMPLPELSVCKRICKPFGLLIWRYFGPLILRFALVPMNCLKLELRILQD
jgi:hypothetical protein